jgi:hypothetical protein
VSRDGKKLYAGTYSPPTRIIRDGRLETEILAEIQCWNTATWELDWASQTKPTNHWALVASPDGKRLGASSGSGFYLYEGKTGAPRGGLVKVGPQD